MFPVAGLVTATHVFLGLNGARFQDVDARDKPGQGILSGERHPVCKECARRGAGLPPKAPYGGNLPQSCAHPLASLAGSTAMNFRPCDEMSQHVVIRSTQATVFAQFSTRGSRGAQPFRDRDLA